MGRDRDERARRKSMVRRQLIPARPFTDPHFPPSGPPRAYLDLSRADQTSFLAFFFDSALSLEDRFRYMHEWRFRWARLGVPEDQIPPRPWPITLRFGPLLFAYFIEARTLDNGRLFPFLLNSMVHAFWLECMYNWDRLRPRLLWMYILDNWILQQQRRPPAGPSAPAEPSRRRR
ncbi:hypothetical protein WAI453_003119 [Rhynchosporium graminicola]